MIRVPYQEIECEERLLFLASLLLVVVDLIRQFLDICIGVFL